MKYSISTKTIALTLFAMLSVSFLFNYVLKQVHKQNLEGIIFKVVRQAADAFAYNEKQDTSRLSSALRVFLESKEFKEVYLAKDRNRLYEYGQPLFKDLKERYGITHFYFHLPEGKTFVRLHNKEIYGDEVNRITFRKARDTGTFGAGLELGKTAFALRVVTPYYKGDKLIGYVEMGEEIDHFLLGLKGKTNNEFALIAKKEHLDREYWKSVRKAQGLTDNWDEIEKYLLLGNPAKNPLAKDCFRSENLEAFEKGISFSRGFSGLDKGFACGGFPIQDAGGRTVGVIMALLDVSDHVALEKKIQRQVVSAYIFLSVLLFIVLFFLMRRLVSRPIGRMVHAVNIIAKGRFDQRVESKGRDEIGELADAFDNMAEELQKTTISRDELVKEMEERKRAEEALRESGETLKAILNATTDAMFLIDADGKILTLNETTALRLGKTKDELAGACIYDHLPPDIAKSRRAYINEAVSSGKTVHFEDERNGEWIAHSIYPIFDEQGKITKIAIYGRYITERKLVEDKLKEAYQELKTAQQASINIMEDLERQKKALDRANADLFILYEKVRESEERFRTVAESAGDAIIGLRSPDVVYLWNRKAEEIFGYTTAEAIGKNMHDLIVPERYRGKALEGLKLFFGTGTGPVVGKAIEIEALRRNGEEFPVELSISAINMEGAWRAIGIVRDITERRQFQQNLERSNKELQDFAYIVSHDLKAPLRAIGTITSWLAEDYKDKLDDAGREQLDLLLNRTQRMHNMIEGILHYSRAGRVMGEPVDVDTGKIVKDVISALSPPANIRITIHDSLPSVFIDSLKIGQIFQNLISNAVKYMDKPEGLIEVGCRDAGEFWEFYVKDNGPGIEERHFERIFQIFQTLKPRDEFESTGIGLSIVKKIIEQNSGRIWVESEIGKGSTFKFTLPKKT